MIKSMTGFASLTREQETATIGVTIRAVNHRYLDVQVRLSSALGELENRLRAAVQRRVGRGRLEMTVTVQARGAPGVEVILNEALVGELSRALAEARARGVIDGTLSAGDLLRFPQALSVRERDEEALVERLGGEIESVVDAALADLDGMRSREGEYLRADLDGRVTTVADLVERLAQAAEEGRAGVEARLAARVKELSHEVPADPAAVAQEIVRTVARSDISEEIARFRGHVAHWRALADGPEPCGRKLDFLLQEMNREVNTIGAKAEGLSIGELIVAAKAELEKMREQVQNVE